MLVISKYIFKNGVKCKRKKEASHKRPHIILFSLYQMSGIGKSIQTKGRLEVALGQGEGEKGVLGKLESDC